MRQVNLFSCVKSVRCSPFLFDKLCKLNSLFTFIPILAFTSPLMTRKLCFFDATNKGVKHILEGDTIYQPLRSGRI